MNTFFSSGTLGRRSKKACSSTQPAQETYRLNCYIAGDKSAFSIFVPTTAGVEELAKCIHEKGDVKWRIMDLVLWKANIDITSLGVLSRVNMDDYKSAMEMLNYPGQPITELWARQPPQGRLHIMVETPAEGGPPIGTSQIPPQIGLDLACLVVKNDGAPLGNTFVLSQIEDRFVSELAERIKGRRSDIPSDVVPDLINLWKPDPPFSSPPSGPLSAVNALHLNQPGSEQNVIALSGHLPLSHYFAPGQLQAGQIHVIAQLPLDRGEKKDKSHLLLMSSSSPAFETEITFTIPSKARFQSLKKSDINVEEVESAPVEEIPPFLRKFYDDLARRRCVPANSPLVTALSTLFPLFGKSFDNYFRVQDQPHSVPDLVTNSEIGQYIHVILSRDILNVDWFQVSKEGQIGATFLHDLAGEFGRRGGNSRACFRTAWAFPLLAVPRDEENTKFRYTPMNDFRLEIEHFSFCVLEVVSGKKAGLENQPDLWRMILQASCLARLGNKLRCNTDDPVVIVAIFIDARLQAHEYLVYQPDVSNKKVLYRETTFTLTRAEDAFEFIFRLYNLLSRVTDDSHNLNSPLIELAKIEEEVPENVYPSLTSGRGRKRKGDAGGGGADTDQHADPGPSGTLGQRSVQASLKEAGYELTPTDGMLVPITPLKPTMCDATFSDGVHVVLKVIDDDTDELAVLERLNEIKSTANHTIELHGIIENSIANVIALRWRIPLNEYFRFHHPPESAASFPEQFLEGVAFLHEYKVAHLDLKPANVVVDDLGRERKHPPRLVIIDFGLSIFVEDEHTTIEGFCGTPPWVAPEVGTHDGPDMTYSPIFADRWACGQMVNYLEKRLAGGGDGSQGQIQEMLKNRLVSADPRARPAVKEVLDAYRVGTKGVKRIARAEESDGTLKRARVNPADSIDR